MHDTLSFTKTLFVEVETGHAEVPMSDCQVIKVITVGWLFSSLHDFEETSFHRENPHHLGLHCSILLLVVYWYS
jgi:hypothetical protein